MRKILFLLVVFTLACSKAIIKAPEIEYEVSETLLREESFKKKETLARYLDGLKEVDIEGFMKAVDIILPYLEKKPEKIFSVKGKQFTALNFSQKLRGLKEAFNKFDYLQVAQYINDNFCIVKVTEGETKTLFTGYYVPLLEARRVKDDTFKYPIYAKPEDLITLNLSPLGYPFKNEVVVGRIDSEKRFVPYYSRKEIEKDGILKNRNLELCYLKDPLDVLLLQIQGSGFLKMEDGEIILASYAGKNGREYKSIGKYLIEKNYLLEEEVSWKSIRDFLKNNPDKFDEVIYHNESYVFFNLKGDSEVVGSSHLPLVPFYSIAVDKNNIPLLSLSLISFDIPIVGENNLVTGFKDFTSLAFAMDEGSAIKGAERVDLFCGFGEEAEKVAHILKSEGELFVLVPK